MKGLENLDLDLWKDVTTLSLLGTLCSKRELNLPLYLMIFKVRMNKEVVLPRCNDI